MPAGADFVQARLTWPSGPNVSLESTVYDSQAATSSRTARPSGGYGHLSFDQISRCRAGRAAPGRGQAQAVEDRIYPTSGMAPSAPQIVHLASHSAPGRATSITLSQQSVTLKPGRRLASGHRHRALGGRDLVRTASRSANGATTTTIPVAVRVPVTLTTATAASSGTITGSTVEYSGGELYFYDVHVPAGTRSLTASLTGPTPATSSTST